MAMPAITSISPRRPLGVFSGIIIAGFTILEPHNTWTNLAYVLAGVWHAIHVVHCESFVRVVLTDTTYTPTLISSLASQCPFVPFQAIKRHRQLPPPQTDSSLFYYAARCIGCHSANTATVVQYCGNIRTDRTPSV